MFTLRQSACWKNTKLKGKYMKYEDDSNLRDHRGKGKSRQCGHSNRTGLTFVYVFVCFFYIFFCIVSVVLFLSGADDLRARCETFRDKHRESVFVIYCFYPVCFFGEDSVLSGV